MKKRLCAILALLMLLAFSAACSNTSGGNGNGGSSSSDAAVTGDSSGAVSEQQKDEKGASSFELAGDVEFVCPFSAGGGSDLYARTAANIMSQLELTGKRTVTINNKPGGGGAVGDAYTFNKAGDGTSITTYVSAQVTGPMINKTEITYEDMTPICNLAMDEYTLGVLSTAQYQTLDDFIAYAKENPGKISVGGSGSGTEDELVTGLVEMYCDIDLEYIAYDSSAEVMSAMLGGHISAGIYNPNEAKSQYENGDVTLLAAFGPERISILPDVPTFTELGYKDVQFQQFRGIFGPGGMTEEAVNYWVGVFSRVVEHEDWIEGYLAANGLTGKFIYGDEFTEFVKAESMKYEAALDSLGLLAK